jgi:hypothetical protein
VPGKSDLLDLGSFYPFIACLVEACRVNGAGLHQGQTHVILNSPNPGSHPVAFFDGSAANLILLGSSISMHQTGSEQWWPSAASPKVRFKMLRRIMRDGFLLPLLTSVCVALLAEMYTTTATSAKDSSDGKEMRRVRLQYGSAPIADFGIVTGTADVKNQDKLAYYNVVDNVFEKGQDPEDHYWLYFTTVRGEELTLDCGMFVHNMCLLIADTQQYCLDILPNTGSAPAVFFGREFARNAPRLTAPRERFSFLRNEALHSAVAHTGANFKGMNMEPVFEFMESIAGRNISAVEQDLTRKWTLINCLALNVLLKDRRWVSWPKEPTLGIEADPGESITASYDDEDWAKYMKKWNRMHKRGEISSERLRMAFEKFEARMAARAAQQS